MKNVLKRVLNTYRNLSPALKAGIWFFVCTFLQKGISVLTTPIFTRILTTEEYGLFSVYISWSDILSIFITFGLSSSVYQKKLVQLQSEEDRDTLTSSLQGLATFTALISFLFYILNRTWINRLLALPTELVISIYIGVLCTTAFGFWSMRQRVDFRYKKLLTMTVFTSVAKPVLGIAGIYIFPQFKVYARIYTLVGVEFVAYIGLYINQFREGKRFYDKDYWKYALRFVLPLIPHYISQRILSQSDRIMINNMVGTSEAGIYSLAHSIGWLMTMAITALDYTLAPWTYQKLKGKNIKRLKDFSIVPVLFMASACFVFILFTPELVSVFAGKDYREAIWVIPPLVMSTYFIMLYTMFIYLEYYYEKTKSVMVATLCSAALNIVLNYLFINMFGYFAAAYTSLVCYILYSLFHYIVFKKICKNNYGESVYDMKAILMVTLLFVAVAFLAMALYSYLVIRILILAALLVILIKKRSKIMSMTVELFGIGGGK